VSPQLAVLTYGEHGSLDPAKPDLRVCLVSSDDTVAATLWERLPGVLKVPVRENPLGVPLMIDLWDERPILVSQLEQCLGSLAEPAVRRLEEGLQAEIRAAFTPAPAQGAVAPAAKRRPSSTRVVAISASRLDVDDPRVVRYRERALAVSRPFSVPCLERVARGAGSGSVAASRETAGTEAIGDEPRSSGGLPEQPWICRLPDDPRLAAANETLAYAAGDDIREAERVQALRETLEQQRLRPDWPGDLEIRGSPRGFRLRSRSGAAFVLTFQRGGRDLEPRLASADGVLVIDADALSPVPTFDGVSLSAAVKACQTSGPRRAAGKPGSGARTSGAPSRARPRKR